MYTHGGTLKPLVSHLQLFIHLFGVRLEKVYALTLQSVSRALAMQGAAGRRKEQMMVISSSYTEDLWQFSLSQT